MNITAFEWDFKELRYFGKTYCNPTELLERTVNYQKLGIPHEVLLDEGAIMYSLNWLFTEEALRFLKDFPETYICDKLGNSSIYKVKRLEDCVDITAYRRTIVIIRILGSGLLEFVPCTEDYDIYGILKTFFDYDVP